MKRRTFISLLGGAAASASTFVLSTAGRAQAPTPVIGFLHSASLEPNAKRLTGFKRGLQSAGYREGQNIAIEYRWAGGQNVKLPEFANELVKKPVSIIVTLSSTPAARAAKAATSMIPIFFLIAEDPVELGLVASLNHPGGNATGISSQNGELVAKRLGLLRELLPEAPAIAVLLNPLNSSAKRAKDLLQQAANGLGVQLNVLEASTDAEIETVYATLKPGSPLLIGTDPSLFARRASLIVLSAKHGIPTMYDNRESADAGGLISYGQNTESSWEQAGIYVGRILKGAKPAELPVMQPTKFEYVINLKTARVLGIDVPAAMQARADEVIE
ncbi:ABC transporter substrate-binding protein [Bradyrhizobium sp. 162]|uniref:ABC transporter substrate-binding protein n=1 Tax=Bradyrhizobium sp. 162 TaxID=2782635 RepID=UPI001FFBCE61|nr:ABC transporter substrate-binding protein [Bradyrhizobium sp. 162]